MAMYAPIMGAPSRATMFHPYRETRFRRLLATLSPDEIGDAVEALIARLDLLAGDADLEEDDHAGDLLDEREAASDDGRGLLSVLPIWPIDQTREPSNYREASRDHQAAEMGLVRSPSGGWKHA